MASSTNVVPRLALLDSGCSKHTLREVAHTATDVHNHVPQVCGTPTGATMLSSAKSLLDLPTLPQEARVAHKYPDLSYRSLLSVGQLCDAGYNVFFHKDRAEVQQTTTGKVVLAATRDADTGLYLTPLQQRAAMVHTADILT